MFDDEIARFVRDYMAEREALVESQVARRRELVGELLSDGPMEGWATAYDELGIEFSRFHTGVVVTREPGARSLDTLRLVRLLRDAVDGADVLVLPAGDNRVWAWVSTVSAHERGSRQDRARAGLARRSAIGGGSGGARSTRTPGNELAGRGCGCVGCP